MQDRKQLFEAIGKIGDIFESKPENEHFAPVVQPNTTPATAPTTNAKLRAGLSPFYTDLNTAPDLKFNDPTEPDVIYPP